MFHVISGRRSRLARNLAALRNGQISEYATWHGWETTKVARSTWCYRDPRFTQLAALRAAETQETSNPGRTWAQAAIAGQITRLNVTTGSGRPGGGRDAV
jgi:hypothetical protein